VLLGEIIVEALQQQRFCVFPDYHQQSIVVQRTQNMHGLP